MSVTCYSYGFAVYVERMTISIVDDGSSCVQTKSSCEGKRRFHTGINPPNVGDWIYVPTRISISRGWDDIMGGAAQVIEVRDEPRINGGTQLIRVAQVERGFYWNNLSYEQSALREQHGPQLARPDPDFTSYG